MRSMLIMVKLTYGLPFAVKVGDGKPQNRPLDSVKWSTQPPLCKQAHQLLSLMGED